MKKIELKNMVTEVPNGAIMINDVSELLPDDKIMIVWDNPKFPMGVEKNSRLYTTVKTIDKDIKAFTHGTDFDFHKGSKQGLLDTINCTSCTSGFFVQKYDAKFPHIVFKLN